MIRYIAERGYEIACRLSVDLSVCSFVRNVYGTVRMDFGHYAAQCTVLHVAAGDVARGTV